MRGINLLQKWHRDITLRVNFLLIVSINSKIVELIDLLAFILTKWSFLEC